MGEESLKFVPLTEASYRIWAAQVSMHLKAKEVWGTIQRGLRTTALEIPLPPTPGASGSKGKEPSVMQEALEKPEKEELADMKAMSILFRLAGSKGLNQIAGCKTSYECWITLRDYYAPLGLQQLGSKIKAFNLYTPDKGTKIQDIRIHLDTLQEEIGLIKPTAQPSDDIKLERFYDIVKDIEPQYAPLVLQLQLSAQELGFEAVVSHFSEWERRLGDLSPERSGKGKETAFEATDSSRGDSKRFKGKCFYCKKEGHRKNKCKTRKRDEREGKTSSSGSGPSTGPLATPSGAGDSPLAHKTVPESPRRLPGLYALANRRIISG